MTARFRRCRLRFFRILSGRGRRRFFRLLRLARLQGQDEVFNVNPRGPSLTLLLPLDQANAVLVQFPEQLCSLVLAAAHEVHGILLGEVDVDAPVAVHPAVFHRQAYTVHQEAVEDLGLNGNAL